MIFCLKLQGLFSDKGKSTRQVALKTIMNTKIQVILEILPDSFGMCKKILRVKWCTDGSQGSLGFSIKKKKKNIK